MSLPSSWTPDRLSGLATAYWHSATLVAAVELRVFDVLGDQTCSADELAAATKTQAALIAPLLNALTAIELLDSTPHGYRIAAGALPLLLRESPTCMLDALAYNVDLYRHWGSLADVIRTGQSAVAQGAQLGDDTALTERFVCGMESKARAYTPAVAPLIELGEAATLLDVGSGPGTLARHLAETHPHLKVTLLDLPEVIAAARAINATSPVADRLAYHVADYRAGHLPGVFDAVLYAGALHQESRASAEALFAEFDRVVAPGGTLIVVDLLLDEQRTSPAFSAMFQLNMLLLQPTSRVFSEAEVGRLMTGAGLTSVQVRRPSTSPYRVMTARKPKA